ncbi:hypothetical protein U4I65_02395 [Stenotrophomonas maltophilia]|uniref:hypothetical protein n=1 Tax=Stenotrophomonas maltophilia TaxID=40324 RepID=UPI002ACC7395|nr:hypothetical protein [Stenotrophomonas maltophilia]MDZ5813886.1 hypothetical protein [Stenotrophomonas maltophilia]
MSRVDVLAVIDREISRAGGVYYSDGRDLMEARAAVAELVEAVEEIGCGRSFRIAAAVARVKGSAGSAFVSREIGLVAGIDAAARSLWVQGQPVNPHAADLLSAKAMAIEVLAAAHASLAARDLSDQLAADDRLRAALGACEPETPHEPV